MSHPRDLIDRILALVTQDYPPAEYRATIERMIPGTRMCPDILISTAAGQMQCAVEIGYTRPEKLTAYRQELHIPDGHFLDREHEGTVRQEIHAEVTRARRAS